MLTKFMCIQRVPCSLQIYFTVFSVFFNREIKEILWQKLINVNGKKISVSLSETLHWAILSTTDLLQDLNVYVNLSLSIDQCYGCRILSSDWILSTELLTLWSCDKSSNFTGSIASPKTGDITHWRVPVGIKPMFRVSCRLLPTN